MSVSGIEVNNYRYFFYSKMQVLRRNEIEANIGKRFVPGVVYVNGRRHQYTEICKENVSQYSDAVLIAEGDLGQMRYTPTSSAPKKY